MKEGALALLVHGGTENWSPHRWKRRFDEVCPDRRVLQWPDAAFDPADIHYAAVWNQKRGDHRGRGARLDGVSLVRVAVGALAVRMTESVVLHALMHHRQELYLWASQ